MAKKEPKAYVYKITNNINGRWYIGSHNGTRPYYMGSGKALKLAIKKYGAENFTKEILFYTETYLEDEEKLLNELDASHDPMSYNLVNLSNNPQDGKPQPEELNKQHSIRMSGEGNPNYGRDFSEQHRRRLSISHSGERHPLFGKHLSDELKKKISEVKTGVPQELAECPICGEIGGISNMKRWHFDNCGKEFHISEEHKEKISITLTGVKQYLVTCPHCGLEGGYKTMNAYHFEKCNFKRRKINVKDGKEFFTSEELAELFSIKRHGIYDYTKKGFFKPVKIGKRNYYKVKDIIKKFGLEEDWEI